VSDIFEIEANASCLAGSRGWGFRFMVTRGVCEVAGAASELVLVERLVVVWAV
jgi:hypothetical protein